jgi:hypothetical protein
MAVSNDSHTGGDRVNDPVAGFSGRLFIGGVVGVALGLAAEVAGLWVIGAIAIIIAVFMLVMTRAPQRAKVEAARALRLKVQLEKWPPGVTLDPDVAEIEGIEWQVDAQNTKMERQVDALTNLLAEGLDDLPPQPERASSEPWAPVLHRSPVPDREAIDTGDRDASRSAPRTPRCSSRPAWPRNRVGSCYPCNLCASSLLWQK